MANYDQLYHNLSVNIYLFITFCLQFRVSLDTDSREQHTCVRCYPHSILIMKEYDFGMQQFAWIENSFCCP